MIKPNPTIGMRHVALFVKNYEATEQFYVDLLGMRVEWRPDGNAVYLTSGNDNLALHRVEHDFCGNSGEGQHLDHIGFFHGTIHRSRCCSRSWAFIHDCFWHGKNHW